jgi:hypothetical protein
VLAPCQLTDRLAHLVEIGPVPGGEIVQADHLLA